MVLTARLYTHFRDEALVEFPEFSRQTFEILLDELDR
jgi:hypothetical protein